MKIRTSVTIVMNKELTSIGHILQDFSRFKFTSNPVIYGFTGRQFDSESGLYYYRNRSYDPMSGRFMTKDALGIQSGDVKLYRYTGNDTVNKTDPYGLFDFEWFGMMNTIAAGTFIGFRINELKKGSCP